MTPERKAGLRAIATDCQHGGAAGDLAAFLDEALDALDTAERERDEARRISRGLAESLAVADRGNREAAHEHVAERIALRSARARIAKLEAVAKAARELWDYCCDAETGDIESGGRLREALAALEKTPGRRRRER